MKTGDLIKFDYISGHTRHLNRRVALYLGEDFIHRDDGVVVENHRVLMASDCEIRIIDKGLLRYMRVVSESR